MNLSPDFIQTIRNTFGADGEAFLTSLPDLLEDASRRWNLTDIQPVSNLSYNFVAFAVHPSTSLRSAHLYLRHRHRQDEVVLKLGVPHKELSSEIAALRFFDGRGACCLLDADADQGMLLLERLLPGRMLASVFDDEQATRIAAEVMSQLWRPVPANRDDFIQLRDWFTGFERLRQHFNGGTGLMPAKLVETAERLSLELLAENKDEVLLHGDFHHFNVLESERGWLAIDPKGVIGPRGYEVGPLLVNPVPDFLNGSNPEAWTEKRIAILSEMLGMERECVRNWGISHAVLSAWWSIEDNDPDWGEYSLRCAEIFMQV